MSVAQTQTTASKKVSTEVPSPTPSARYVLDASHSHVGFSVRHMMISNVRGEFQKVSAEATLDLQRPQDSTISATIDLASINTRDEKRDAHLRGPDFFNAEAHPQMTFRSTEVRRREEGFEVVGELTLGGTTRPVTLTVDEVTPEHQDPWGNTRIGATARAKIRRSDYGMKWNAALEAGGVLVGDEVSIQIETEWLKQKG